MALVSVPARIASQLPSGQLDAYGEYLAHLLADGLKNISGSWPYLPNKCHFVRAPICLTYQYKLEPYAYVVWLFILSSYRNRTLAEIELSFEKLSEEEQHASKKLPRLPIAAICKGTSLSRPYVQKAIARLIDIGVLLQEKTEVEYVYLWRVRWRREWIWCPFAVSVLARPMPPRAKVALIRLFPLVITHIPRAVHLYTQEFAQVVGTGSVRRARDLRKLLCDEGFLKVEHVQEKTRERMGHEIDLLGERIFGSQHVRAVVPNRRYEDLELSARVARRRAITQPGKLL